MQSHIDFPSLYVFDHPLIQHKLTQMRKKDTPVGAFRRLLHEISLLMGYELTRHLPMTTDHIETPIQMMHAPVVDGQLPVIVPILRAGQGMADGLVELMPDSAIGYIGVYRDEETKRPVEYLKNLPTYNGQVWIAVDPMLATGHSAEYAIGLLREHGVPEDKIRFMSLVSAPEGVKVVADKYPDIPIYTASLDEKLNEKAYIVPGLGDAGDRLFGTV